jgi:hypothetical protein
MKTVITIRMHYPEDSPIFEWRFHYFASMVLPRIKKQRGVFDIAVWCEEHHADLFRSLGVIPFSVKEEYRGYIRPGYEKKSQEYHVDFVPWEAVQGLERYELQLALDSDDLLLRDDYIERIIGSVLDINEPTHVCFQPYIFNLDRLTFYKAPVRYSTTRGSAFYALYLPLQRAYTFVYDNSHLKMQNVAQRRIYVPEGFCAYTVHGSNASSGMPQNPEKVFFE